MNKVDAVKTKEDLNMLKSQLHGRDKLLVVIGVSLGLRISDLLALKVGDIRGQNRIRVVEQKTGKTRHLYFGKSVIAAGASLTGDNDDYVFVSRKRGPNGKRKPISRTQAYRILNDAASKAGLDIAVGTHTLRKTFGRMMHENGVDLSRIMVILGHSSEAMTAKYIGITDDEIKAAYQALEV